jgi:uroporphyrinogen-III synthase
VPPAPPTVALTRAHEDNAELASLLRGAGLGVIEWPATAVRTLVPAGGAEAVAAAVGGARVVAFTSRRGVDSALEIGGAAVRELLAAREVAAVGPATAARLEREGFRARWIAKGSGSAELADALAAGLPRGTRVLLLRSAAADGVLPTRLASAGLRVEDVRVYGPVRPARPADTGLDVAVITCASPSAARRVRAWREGRTETATYVAIGPATARALRDVGGAPRVVTARSPRVQDVRDAVLAAIGSTKAAANG